MRNRLSTSLLRLLKKIEDVFFEHYSFRWKMFTYFMIRMYRIKCFKLINNFLHRVLLEVLTYHDSVLKLFCQKWRQADKHSTRYHVNPNWSYDRLRTHSMVACHNIYGRNLHLILWIQKRIMFVHQKSTRLFSDRVPVQGGLNLLKYTDYF